ncbi:MAG: ACT domain-containing protein [Verrucomicrobia bacterium]|nr:ACT domain-containing protein [Verrucomicrobiota bacterium]
MLCTVERQLSVAIENQPGRLAAIARLLASNNINIRSLSVLDNIEQGMIRFIPSNAALAKELLIRSGLYVVEADVLAVAARDVPGELARIGDSLAEARINIDYAYGTDDAPEQAMRIILKVSNIKAAADVLSALHP